MKKLFLFGDSFTFGHGCTPNEPYSVKYKKDDDALWFEILQNEFNLNIENYGMGLYSNDKIIDSIIDAYDNINEGDYVIIEKGFTHRFDIPNMDDNVLITIAPNSKHLLTKNFTQTTKDYSDDEIKHIEYMITTLDSELIRNRQIKRLNFLKKIIEKNKKPKKCILWDILDYLNPNEYENIVVATNGEIIDHHWSFNGHRKFAEKMIYLLKSELKMI